MSWTRPLAKWLLLLLALLLLPACSGPQSALDPAGPSALAIAWLWWGMFAAFGLVFVGVVALWLYALARKTGGMGDKRARQISQRWIIGGGIILPSVSIVVLLLFGIPAGRSMLPLSTENGSPLTIRVIGHQWWWEIHYPDAGVVTANELVMPAGEAVDFHLSSLDVIHSFWIPRLGGKLDVLPGRTNVLRLEASQPGSFRGQCAEFCGWGHAHMVLPVQARSRADFEAWLRARQQPVELNAEHQAGAAAFQEHCGHCHRVNGVTNGGVAPDLSSVGARPVVGGISRRDDNGIAYWLRHHRTPEHDQHASAAFPDHSVMAPQHLDAIAAWLETLGND
ncbi:MAG: cytochrome c oxidase subunit II [Cellvibrionaceae bacterium]